MYGFKLENGVGIFDLRSTKYMKIENFFTTDVGLKYPLFKEDYRGEALTFRDSVYRNRYA
jgi:hypothetical protein